jgi:molybdopterin-guanine dinucleotide biosynthesis protein A
MGTDKAFVKLDGSTLLARSLALARSVSNRVCIVGRSEKFAAFATVAEDVFSDCGPLGGIHSALRNSQTDLNLMLAVDMPFISQEFLAFLVQKARLTEAQVVVPRANGSLQPLCAIYRREFFPAAENALRLGKNRIDRLFDAAGTRVIEEEELVRAGFTAGIFRNLNTNEELKAQQAISDRG